MKNEPLVPCQGVPRFQKVPYALRGTIGALVEFMENEVSWPPEVIFHNNKRQVVDLGTTSPLRETARLSNQSVQVREVPYFYTALFHPNLHIKLVEVLDAHIARHRPKDFNSREEIINAFGVWYRPDEETTSERLGPIGVSVVIASYENDCPEILIGLRADNVAVMPNVWTTSCDETMSTLGGWYRTKVADALNSEMSFSRALSDEQVPQFLGWMIPNLRAASLGNSHIYQSGANAVFVVKKSKKELNDMLAIARMGIESGSMSSEFSQYEIKRVDDPFFLEQPITEVLSKTVAAIQSGYE